jgi:hypothetical protein
MTEMVPRLGRPIDREQFKPTAVLMTPKQLGPRIRTPFSAAARGHFALQFCAARPGLGKSAADDNCDWDFCRGAICDDLRHRCWRRDDDG